MDNILSVENMTKDQLLKELNTRTGIIEILLKEQHYYKCNLRTCKDALKCVKNSINLLGINYV